MLEIKKIVKQIIIVGTLATTALAINSSIAHETGSRDGAQRHGGKMGMRGLKELDLTEDQQAQVEALISSVKDTAQTNRERQREVRELSNAGDINQAAELAASIAREKVIARATMKENIRALLTPEQIEQLDAMKEEKRLRREENTDEEA